MLFTHTPPFITNELSAVFASVVTPVAPTVKLRPALKSRPTLVSKSLTTFPADCIVGMPGVAYAYMFPLTFKFPILL